MKHKQSQETRTKITNLEERLREVQIHSSTAISDELAAERKRLQEEREGVKQCLAICAVASQRLREFENKPQVYSSPSVSDEVTAERERLQEEKERSERCLTTCTNTLEHIGQLQSSLSEGFFHNVSSILEGHIPSQQATANNLQECKETIADIAVGFKGHIQEINTRLQAFL